MNRFFNMALAAFALSASVQAATPQEIIYNSSNPGLKYFGDAPFEVFVRGGGSDNPVVIVSDDTVVCTVSGSTITILKTGDCEMRLNQAGDGTYDPAPEVSKRIRIFKARQSIDFDANNPFSVSIADGAFTLMVSGGESGNPVIMSSADDDFCTVEGNVVTPVRTGACVVRANQAGDENYDAAYESTKYISINSAQTSRANCNGDEEVNVLDVICVINAVFSD